MHHEHHAHSTPPKESVIAFGITGYIYKLDNEDSFIVKRPKRSSSEKDHTKNPCYEAVLRDRNAYERLGPHPGIIAYYGPYDDSTGAIKLAYAKEGDLQDYINPTKRTVPEPTLSHKKEMIRMIASTFQHIASKDISHHDIKTANILIQEGLPKVCDFSLCYSTDGTNINGDDDSDDVCPENHLRIDLSGLGCVFYSIAKWVVFDHDYYEEDRFLEGHELKSTEGIWCGDVIRKCWLGQFVSMDEMYWDVLLCTATLSSHA